MLPALVLTLVAATPKVGDVAPDFTAQDSQGKFHQLSALVQNGPVILAFFPKAFTRGCTSELSSYRDRTSELQAANATLLAVSTDDAETLEKFRAQLKAPYVFLPDPKGKLTELYDVKTPVVGVAKRTTFVVGPGRKILHVDTGSDALNPESALQACRSKAKPAP